MKRLMQLAAVSAILGLGVVASHAETITVGGGGAAMSTIFDPVGAPFEKASGMALVRRPSSPANGLVELANGTLELATAAVPLESMIAGAAKAGVTVDAAKLAREQIGINRTVLFLHPSNPVTKLSKSQVKGIFTGKIANWKEVGGEDKAIIVVWGAGTPGQNAQFTKEILDGEAVTREVMDATNYASIRETVAATPEAIGIDPYGMADGSVKVVPNDPELTSPIIAVTIGKPSPKVQKLIDFVKGEGQQYVKK